MKIILLFVVLIVYQLASAQDSLNVSEADTSNFERVEAIQEVEHSPTRAGLYSAALPGLGQIYNKKAWKVPIVYLAVGGAAYFAIDNGKKKRRYQDAIEIRNDGDSTTVDEFDGIASSADLIRIRNTFRERQDLSYVLGGLFYTLNIIDAIVDAHLYDFEISDDLSMKLEPQFQPGINSSDTYVGLGISLNLK